jgi:ankyrin repeat protein
VLGGHYDKQSKNPIWAMKSPTLATHTITRGVKPFDLREEWYYKLKFGDITPILSAVPPEEGGVNYPLAWVHGTHVFGCTGGHFLSSWGQPDFRKLILNAIVWAAGSAVPEGGVVSVDPVVVKNKSILHAIAKGDPADVRNHLLLGADANQKNKQGWTPLHFCAVRGKTECARVLIESGAEIDPLTGTQKTPLHFAAERNFLPLVKLLVEHGANLSACDNEGWSPLHYAAEKDRIEVATYLIKKGAVVDLVSTRGGTPLHEASASASSEMIQLLLKSGADKTIKATNGKTPLDYAIELGNAPAAALLK